MYVLLLIQKEGKETEASIELLQTDRPIIIPTVIPMNMEKTDNQQLGASQPGAWAKEKKSYTITCEGRAGRRKRQPQLCPISGRPAPQCPNLASVDSVKVGRPCQCTPVPRILPTAGLTMTERLTPGLTHLYYTSSSSLVVDTQPQATTPS